MALQRKGFKETLPPGLFDSLAADYAATGITKDYAWNFTHDQKPGILVKVYSNRAEVDRLNVCSVLSPVAWRKTH